MDMLLEEFHTKLLDETHAALFSLEIYIKDGETYDFERFPGHIFCVYRQSADRFFVLGSFVGQYSLYDYMIGEDPAPYYRGPFNRSRAVQFYTDIATLLQSDRWTDEIATIFDRCFGTHGYLPKQLERELHWQFVLWGAKALQVCGRQDMSGKPYTVDTCAFCQCCKPELFALPQYSFMRLGDIAGVNLSFHH